MPDDSVPLEVQSFAPRVNSDKGKGMDSMSAVQKADYLLLQPNVVRTFPVDLQATLALIKLIVVPARLEF